MTRAKRRNGVLVRGLAEQLTHDQRGQQQPHAEGHVPQVEGGRGVLHRRTTLWESACWRRCSRPSRRSPAAGTTQSTVAYDLLRASRRMHTAASANPKTATGLWPNRSVTTPINSEATRQALDEARHQGAEPGLIDLQPRHQLDADRAQSEKHTPSPNEHASATILTMVCSLSPVIGWFSLFWARSAISQVGWQNRKALRRTEFIPLACLCRTNGMNSVLRRAAPCSITETVRKAQKSIYCVLGKSASRGLKTWGRAAGQGGSNEADLHLGDRPGSGPDGGDSGNVRGEAQGSRVRRSPPRNTTSPSRFPRRRRTSPSRCAKMAM